MRSVEATGVTEFVPTVTLMPSWLELSIAGLDTEAFTVPKKLEPNVCCEEVWAGALVHIDILVVCIIGI